MKSIVCVNINNVMPQVARQSMMHAAIAWDVDYYEIIFNPSVNHPAFVKLLIFDMCEYDDILLIDSDCLINKNCPNPFYEFSGKLMVVDGSPKRLINYTGIQEHIKRELDFFNEKVTTYFNSGVMLVNRKDHEGCFNYAKFIYKDELTWHDQTPLNIALKTCTTEVADETWNYIPQTSLDMSKYIYHFAGYGDKNKAIKEHAHLLNLD